MNDTRLIRQNYDRLADDHACHIFHELENKPFDREVLNHFAAEVEQLGEVCDMGCGPGHIDHYLRDAGTRVYDLDLSRRMIEVAGQRNPDISFREGNMLALDLPNATLGGIVAFYAIVNIPQESLPLVFREVERVLQPGGLLLLGFHVGDETLHPEQLWGKRVSMDSFLFRCPPLGNTWRLEVCS